MADTPAKMEVGGQAVIEGVMMRSPKSFAVACRRSGGAIVIREQQWHSLWHRFPFLKWPFIRGAVVLLEALMNGMSALTFAASLQEEERLEEEEKEKKEAEEDGEREREEADETEAPEPEEETEPPQQADDAEPPAQEEETEPAEEAEDDKGEEPAEEAEDDKGEEPEEKKEKAIPGEGGALNPAAMTGLVVVSVAVALGLFVGLPHLLTWLVGFQTDSLYFHLVDGLFKVIILVAYIASIGLNKDIRRVFMYHGAEHKTIWAHEKKLELNLENVRLQSRFHPRCGTSFLVLVILVSVFLFAVLLQFPVAESRLADNLLKILIKIPLMFPIAGLAYEGIKLAGKHREHPLVRLVTGPGMALQHLTTREPTDDQLEIGILSLEKTLWREHSDEKISEEKAVEEFATFAEARQAIISGTATGD